MNALLSRIYKDYSNPGGLDGINSLYKEAKKLDENITKDQVKTFLEGVRTYTFHKPTRKLFPRRKKYCTKIKSDLVLRLGGIFSLTKI